MSLRNSFGFLGNFGKVFDIKQHLIKNLSEMNVDVYLSITFYDEVLYYEVKVPNLDLYSTI